MENKGKQQHLLGWPRCHLTARLLLRQEQRLRQSEGPRGQGTSLHQRHKHSERAPLRPLCQQLESQRIPQSSSVLGTWRRPRPWRDSWRWRRRSGGCPGGLLAA